MVYRLTLLKQINVINRGFRGGWYYMVQDEINRLYGLTANLSHPVSLIIFPVWQNPCSAVFYQSCPRTAPQRTRYSAPSHFSEWCLYQIHYVVLYHLACTAAPLARVALVELVVAMKVSFVMAQVLPSLPLAKMEAPSVMNMNLFVEPTS